MPKKAQIAGRVANRGEMAGMLGISPVTLDRWVAAGCPRVEGGTTSQGHKFNSAEVFRWVRLAMLRRLVCRRRKAKATPSAGMLRRRRS